MSEALAAEMRDLLDRKGVSVPPDVIRVTKEIQPRRRSDKGELERLTRSVKALGILQPLLVRLIPGDDEHVELVAGHRRLEAARRAGLKSIPILVRTFDTDMARQAALVENLQREDLTPLDEAEAIAKLLEADLAPAEIAERMGLTARYVARRANLKSLSVAWRAALKQKDWDQIPGEWLVQVALLAPEIQDELLKSWQVRGLPLDDDGLARDVTDRLRILRLARWDLDDAELEPGAGACSVCPKNSANSPGLFEEVGPKGRKEGEALCRDDACWIRKATAWRDVRLAKAQEKDLGLQPFYMAGTLLEVRNLRHLPATTPPLTLPELLDFIFPLANRLLDSSRPQES